MNEVHQLHTLVRTEGKSFIGIGQGFVDLIQQQLVRIRLDTGGAIGRTIYYRRKILNHIKNAVEKLLANIGNALAASQNGLEVRTSWRCVQ